MESTAYIALSRQMVLDRQMDVIAHNIANATTSGFKAESMLLEPVPVDAGERQRLAFVQDLGMVRDLSPGPITTTGNPFDLAIEGAGYFAIQTAGGVRYGRSGQLHLNDVGELATADGDPVLDDGGAPLALPLDAGPITIAADGTVSTPSRGHRQAPARDLRRRAASGAAGRRPLSDRPGAAAGDRGASGAGRARGLERAARSSR